MKSPEKKQGCPSAAATERTVCVAALQALTEAELPPAGTYKVNRRKGIRARKNNHMGGVRRFPLRW